MHISFARELTRESLSFQYTLIFKHNITIQFIQIYRHDDFLGILLNY